MKINPTLSESRLLTRRCKPPVNLATALICFLLIFASSQAQGQKDKEDLQKERDRISQEIALTNKLLQEKRDTRNKLEGEVSLLNRKINLREDLIRSLKNEKTLSNKKIESNRAKAEKLEKEIEELKANYAKLIRLAQRTQSSQDRLMYIFASHDFFQAIRRIRYFQQYAKYRSQQAAEILETKNELGRLNTQLLAEIKEKDDLIKNEESTRAALSSDVNEQKTTVSNLQQEEKSLLRTLRKQEKEREKLNKEIQRIIEEEIRSSKKNNAGVFSLTPEAAALSANFEKNKGKLPWPVERGVITAKFGQNPHPVLAGITVPNNGIDIATNGGASVRAVFEGTVSAVFSIPGAGQNVIINHGGYRTVYSNLKDVFVTKGQKVEIKQSLGTVLTDESSGKTESHLEIWKVDQGGTSKQDPAQWIFKQ